MVEMTETVKTGEMVETAETVEAACDIFPAVFAVDENIRFLRRIRRIADEHRTHIILFDADRLAGRAHVE
ncbi:MAG TPA: hypothetical protein PKH49_05685, partial [Methanoculleus sp.]|nr:hypothetical protein [Methanoculleus sp.]